MEQWFRVLVLKTWWNIKDESNSKDKFDFIFQNMIILFNHWDYNRMVVLVQHPCTESSLLQGKKPCYRLDSLWSDAFKM